MTRNKINWQNLCCRRLAFAGFVVLVACMSTGFGKHPTALSSSRDIRRTSRDTKKIIIGLLPVSDYPLLSKFQHLNDVDFYTLDGTGGNDGKLRALSQLGFTELKGISLLNCPAVTDEGIGHLTKIQSIKTLHLEGTAITDEALQIMASQMSLTGLNVANCQKIGMKGLLKIAASETMVEFSFSANALTQEDVVRLFAVFKMNIKWVSVVDREGKLDATALKALAKSNKFILNVSRTGALQDVVTGGGWR